MKSKVAFNLTKRQLICFGTAALIGVPLFFVLRDSGGNTAATLDPDANYTEDKGDFEIPTEDELEDTGEEDTEPI